MPKINQQEYQILKGLDDKWNWIARDEDRCLYALTEKPVKKYDPSLYWDTETEEDYSALELFNERHLFQFIQWEDSEPFNIAELIEEYEYSTEHVSHVVNERVRALGKAWSESEETEVKKDELKRQVEGTFRQFGNNDLTPYELRVRILELIDRLDEPETLTEEWLAENKCSWYKLKVDGYYIPVDKLQNLLVPKQEEVDQAYKSGYETGKQHTFYKGYLEGLADKENEPETVASVIDDFFKSAKRMKEVLDMEVEELEE